MNGNSPFAVDQVLPARPPFSPYQPYGSTGNPFLDIGLNMGAGYVSGQTGYVPMGMSGQNMYDAMEHQRQSARWRDSMQQMMPAQQQVFSEIRQGISATFSNGMSPQEKAAMDKQLQWMMNMAPAELLGNRAVDKLTGGLNVVGMAGNIYAGGQSQIDPVTGYRGFSANTSADLTSNLFNRFFTKDDGFGRTLDPNYMRNTSGFSAMEMGDLYSSLARRGAFTESSDRREAVAGVLQNMTSAERGALMKRSQVSLGGDALADPSKITDQQLNALQGDSEVQPLLRDISGNKIGEKLEGYARAAAAVKDAFIGTGGPQPTIEEIVKMLDEFGAGSASRFSPEKLTGMIRGVTNLAKINDITIEGANQYLNVAQQSLAAAGGSAALATDVGTFGLGMRSVAASQVSGEMGFNSASVDEMGNFATQRAGRAATSKQTNRLAALMRLYDRGALKGNMADVAEKIAKGMPIPENILSMSESEFTSALSSSADMSASMVDQLIQAGDANTVEKHNLVARVSMEGQRVQIKELLSDQLNSGLGEAAISDLGARNSTERDAIRGALSSASGAFLDKFMNSKDALDPEKRMGFISKFLSTSDNAGVRELVDKYKAEYGDDEGLKRLALNFDAQVRVSESDIDKQLGERGMAMTLNQTSAESSKALARTTAEIALSGEMQDGLAGIGGGDIFKNAMRALLTNGQTEIGFDEESKNRILGLGAEALGMQDPAKVAQVMTEMGARLESKRAAAVKDLEGASTDEEKQFYQNKIDAIDQFREKGMSIERLLGVDDEVMAAEDAGQLSASGGDIGNITASSIVINMDGQKIIEGDRATIAINGQSRNSGTT